MRDGCFKLHDSSFEEQSEDVFKYGSYHYHTMLLCIVDMAYMSSSADTSLIYIF